MYKLGLVESPMCECGTDVESIAHLLLHCPSYKTQRENMIDSIELTYIKHSINQNKYSNLFLF